MIGRLIVPVDGSSVSWEAFDVALALAERVGTGIRLVEVATDPVDGRYARTRLDAELQQRGPFDVDVIVEVRLAVGAIADELAHLASLHPTATVVMSSHGRGRSAAVVGSVAERVLHLTFGPIILVGPNVKPTDFSGRILVGVDGSSESEMALPLAAAWAHQLRATPWIVHVTAGDSTAPRTDNDVFDTVYPARLARHLEVLTGDPVAFDELHDQHPARGVTDYAVVHDASMIIASSHGRSGLSRLVMGSVTAGFVRHATCPVTVIRLPHPVHVEERAWMWAY